jgi:signal transduction histidine kinase
MPDNFEKPHFDVSAAVIRQLGEELVTDEVTAVMELVKNSYDADADWVKIEINTRESIDHPNLFYQDVTFGYIKIEDNGFGMSGDDISRSWMKISLSSKKDFKKKGLVTPKGRTPLGEKGVGRLSTQKLGNRLELFTGRQSDLSENHVAFDWNDFTDDLSLVAVPVYVNKLEKKSNEKGTTLFITSLRDPAKWEGPTWDNFRGQISQMIFPYKEKREFEVYLRLNGKNIDLDELSQKVTRSSVSNYSLTVTDKDLIIRGEVKLLKLNGSNRQEDIDFYSKNIALDNGKDFFTYLIDKVNNKKQFLTDLEFKNNEKGVFFSFKLKIAILSLNPELVAADYGDFDSKIIAHPGEFLAEIFDFYFKDSEAVSTAFNSLSEYKRIVQNQAGIRIFRNGFGIKPYGINGEDWLNLGKSHTSGGSMYDLRPGNVIGHVSIDSKKNGKLKEKTDREGFVEDSYSKNFFLLIKSGIERINEIIEKTRRSYNDYRKKVAAENGVIGSITESLEHLRSTSERAGNLNEQTVSLKSNLATYSNRITAISEGNKFKSDIEATRLLDELKQLVETLRNTLDRVNDLLLDSKKLSDYADYLQPQIETLETQLSDFSELAGLGLTSEALTHELANIVDRLIEETERIYQKVRKDDVDNRSVKVFIEYVRSVAKSFNKQLSHIAPSLRYVRENIDKISMKEYLVETKEYYGDKCKGNIEIRAELLGHDFFLNMNKGKFTQIIDNIFLNSEYWLKEKKKREADFSPLITILASEPFIKIFDNGDGIDPSIDSRIFQPFVTMKPKKIGRGLGLFIVQQLLETVGGEIILLNEKNNSGKRYIFQLNMSSVVQ